MCNGGPPRRQAESFPAAVRTCGEGASPPELTFTETPRRRRARLRALSAKPTQRPVGPRKISNA